MISTERMGRAVGAAAVCIILVSSASADLQIESYFPFAAGNWGVAVASSHGKLHRHENGEYVVYETSHKNFITKYRVENTGEVVFGEEMSHVFLFGEQEQPEYGDYCRVTDAGVLQYTSGNPNHDDEWAFWEDGVILVPASGDTGDSFIDSTPMREQWWIWDGDTRELNSWTGTQNSSMSILGREDVTVPAGTFYGTYKIQSVSTTFRTRDQEPFDTDITETTLTRWLAEGIGPVRTEESSVSRPAVGNAWTDTFNRHWELVGFGCAADPNLPGNAEITCLGSEYTSTGDPNSQQAVQDAVLAVQESMQTFQGGISNDNDNAYGSLACVLTMDADAVDQAITAMSVDGASPREQFIRIEFAYDLDDLSVLDIPESELAPYWWDADWDRWVLLGTTIAGEQGEGALATLPEHENLVGYYGVDTVNHVLWANVNHASMYGVRSIPEPTSLSLLAMGGLVFLLRRRL